MRLNCHYNKGVSRFLYQNPSAETLEDVARGGEGVGFDRYLGEPRTAGSPRWGLDALKKESQALVNARESLDQMPKPVTDDNKEAFRQQTINEIFGDLETQEHYINGVREAMESPGFGDKLHDFINSHQSYSRNDFIQWNEDLRNMLGFYPEESYRAESVRMTDKRIAAAFQYVMVDYYKNDVFQITSRDVNPWIAPEGRTGPYTVSVANEYWSYVYGPNSPKKAPGRAHVSPESYDEVDKQTYAEATQYLDAQLEYSTTQPSSVSTQPVDSSSHSAGIVGDEVARRLSEQEASHQEDSLPDVD